MPKITESKVEELCIELLEEQGYKFLSPEEWEAERGNDLSNVILKDRLKKAIARINTHKPEVLHEQAFKSVMNFYRKLKAWSERIWRLNCLKRF